MFSVINGISDILKYGKFTSKFILLKLFKFLFHIMLYGSYALETIRYLRGCCFKILSKDFSVHLCSLLIFRSINLYLIII